MLVFADAVLGLSSAEGDLSKGWVWDGEGFCLGGLGCSRNCLGSVSGRESWRTDIDAKYILIVCCLLNVFRLPFLSL